MGSSIHAALDVATYMDDIKTAGILDTNQAIVADAEISIWFNNMKWKDIVTSYSS